MEKICLNFECNKKKKYNHETVFYMESFVGGAVGLWAV